MQSWTTVRCHFAIIRMTIIKIKKQKIANVGEDLDTLQPLCIAFVFQLLSHVRFFATSWTAAPQASLPFTISQSLLKLMSIESVMLSNHLILCHPLLLLPSIFPSIRVFSSESVLRIRWPKYWSFNFSISPSNDIQDWFPLGLSGLCFSLSPACSL